MLPQQSRTKGFITPLIAIAVLVALGIGGYVFVQYQKTQMPMVAAPSTTPPSPASPTTQNQNPVPTASSSSTSIPVTIPADWKIYRNEKYGFEVKYPPQWTVKQEINYPPGQHYFELFSGFATAYALTLGGANPRDFFQVGLGCDVHGGDVIKTKSFFAKPTKIDFSTVTGTLFHLGGYECYGDNTCADRVNAFVCNAQNNICYVVATEFKKDGIAQNMLSQLRFTEKPAAVLLPNICPSFPKG